MTTFCLLMMRSAMILWVTLLVFPLEAMFEDIDSELERRGVVVSPMVP